MDTENMTIADALLASEDFKKALPYYLKLVHENANNSMAYQGMAQCYYGIRDFKNATSACIRTIELDPKLAIPYTILAYIYFRSNRYEQSLSEAKKAYELSPELVPVLDCYGSILLAGDKINEAIPLLQRALEKDSNRYSARQNLGVAYWKLGNHKRSLEETKKLYILKPSLKNGLRLISAYQRRYAMLLSIISVFMIMASLFFKINILLLIPAIMVIQGWRNVYQLLKEHKAPSAIYAFLSYALLLVILYLIYIHNIIGN